MFFFCSHIFLAIEFISIFLLLIFFMGFINSSIFGPNSVSVAHYASFIGAKSPTKCDAQLTESNFQTRPKAGVTRKIVVISDYLCYNRINSENVGNQYRKERKYGQSD